MKRNTLSHSALVAALSISISTFIFVSRTDAQSASKDPVSNGVVSHRNTDPPHEWTMEELLLAEPMPMSGEERGFSSGHKQLQSIRDWSLADFEKYTDVTLGKRHAIETASRWMSIRRMLRTQVGVSKAFLSGKPPAKPSKDRTIRPSPPPSGGAHTEPARDTGSAAHQPDWRGAEAEIGSTGASGSASGSPGMEPENPFESPLLARYKHLTIQGVTTGDFAVNDAAFSNDRIEKTFNDLKECRQNISDLCHQLEKLKATGKARGMEKKLDWLLSTYE